MMFLFCSQRVKRGQVDRDALDGRFSSTAPNGGAGHRLRKIAGSTTGGGGNENKIQRLMPLLRE